MKYTELFSFEDLELELQNGYVREVRHPSLPLTIFNYTEKAQFDSRWNDVTLHCRGLIVDYKDEIVARGPRKFFNYGQPGATNYPLSTPVRVSRKEDGSLGIGWRYEKHHGIATRGSFTSEQATHATPKLSIPDKMAIEWAEERGRSRAWEIVYPDNKIVLDYKGVDENIRLGTVDNRSGLIAYRPGVPKQMTLGEALALPIPEGEEGYVLDIMVAGEVVDHLKLKGEWYKRMHSAVFGLTEKKVWEAWDAGTLFEFISELPDELQPWAMDVGSRFETGLIHLRWEVAGALHAMHSVLGIGASRKDQAAYLLTHYKPFAPGVFCLLDQNGQKLRDWISKQVKPTKHVPFNSHDVQHTNA